MTNFSAFSVFFSFFFLGNLGVKGGACGSFPGRELDLRVVGNET